MDGLGAPRRRVAAALLAVALLTAVGAAWRAGADPAPGWTVASPGGALTARVTAHAGAYELTVLRGGRPVLSTPLGREAGDARATEDTLQDAYATPAGKRRRHALVARRLRLALANGRSVELLVADDGVAFRVTGAGREVAAWSAPARARAWLQSYRPDYEGAYEPVALRAAKAADYGFPALLKTGDTWALLTESGLTREPAARLSVRRGRPGVLQVALPPRAAAPRTTPWRVAVVGDLATVVGSDLPLSLGRPSRIRDTSWILPGRVAWSWWSDADSPGDVRRQRAFVREAAGHRWQYVLLDAGWVASDVPGIARYAGRKGVRVMLWTEWWKLRDARRRERLLARWASWGVAGVKVDFLLSDSAARMGIYDDIARDAARHRLAVVFHGCTVPRGIQRTWPNVLTMEAVEGAEREIPAQGAKAKDPRQDVNLVFTRNVLGSMDYTPVTFSARHRRTTDAHRLALAVVYESGLQHFADSPESYARHPQATQVLTDVPTAWDDTRLLAGAPDREAIVGRRAGATWWIGSISATAPHEQTVSLRFLTPGRRYRLHLVRDDGHGGLAVEDRTVTSGDRLSVPVERNGGYTAELTPDV
jgi:alpha-glucosidase